ncbi:neuropeptide Y receptor type 1-like [Montipora capricornis]|uniref:neuropeptide Y receptor type 1-like n=1 Tax=Montipora capricornis TaxID=246305 RepID=UPI0035F12451
MPCPGNSVNQTIAAASNITSSSAPEPEALRILRVVSFGVIAAFALVGNYVVNRAVWRNPGPKPIAHYLVSSMAIAEIVTMICLIFTFHAYERPYSWELGHTMCKIVEPLQISSLLVVTTTLAILAVYRCVLLVKPMVTKPTRKQTCRAILLSWLGCIGLSLPAGYYRVVTDSHGENCEILYCEELFPEGLRHHQNTYSIVLFVLNFALPLVIIAICYSLVSKKIREHIFVIKRLQDEQNRALSSVTQYSVCVEESQIAQRGSLICQSQSENKEEVEPMNIQSGNRKEKSEKRGQKKFVSHVNLEEQDEKKGNSENKPREELELQKQSNKGGFELENDLLRMVYALVLIFLICYIPFQVQFLMIEFKVEAFMLWPHKYTFSRFVFLLTCLPSALHPICYGMMSKFYHKAFIRMIACRKFRE